MTDISIVHALGYRNSYLINYVDDLSCCAFAYSMWHETETSQPISTRLFYVITFVM
jgi:hypothetical protein